jgi:hypothetical protein
VRRSSSADAAGVSWYVMPDIHVTQGHREYMGFFHAMALHPHGEFEESNVAAYLSLEMRWMMFNSPLSPLPRGQEPLSPSIKPSFAKRG